MKLKNIFFVLAFFLIAGLSIYILWEEEQNEKVPPVKDFAVESTDELVKIFLADKSGETILLEKQSDGSWLLNGQYEAMPEKIDLLLNTLKNIRVNYPVPESQWDVVIRNLATQSVKVELYKEKESPFKTYFVGDAPAGGHGAFMIREVNGETADQPFVCHMPGYIAELKNRFYTNELEWRNLNIFNYELDDIKSLGLYYYRNPENSFKIIQEGEDARVEAYADTLPGIDKAPNQKLVTQYLSFYEKLNAEGFAENYELKDSILQTSPYAKLTVTGKNGQTDELKIFYMPLNKRSSMQYDPMGEEITRDLENYYGLHNGTSFVTIQDFVFGKTFKRYEQFFMERE